MSWEGRFEGVDGLHGEAGLFFGGDIGWSRGDLPFLNFSSLMGDFTLFSSDDHFLSFGGEVKSDYGVDMYCCEWPALLRFPYLTTPSAQANQNPEGSRNAISHDFAPSQVW